MFSQPVGGIRIHMHFMLSVHYTALRGDVFAFVRRYLRPCPQISPSSPADIFVLARRYLCPWPYGFKELFGIVAEAA